LFNAEDIPALFPVIIEFILIIDLPNPSIAVFEENHVAKIFHPRLKCRLTTMITLIIMISNHDFEIAYLQVFTDNSINKKGEKHCIIFLKTT
jgi:hypothetical protein